MFLSFPGIVSYINHVGIFTDCGSPLYHLKTNKVSPGYLHSSNIEKFHSHRAIQRLINLTSSQLADNHGRRNIFMKYLHSIRENSEARSRK
jgi:hypothetical protein